MNVLKKALKIVTALLVAVLVLLAAVLFLGKVHVGVQHGSPSKGLPSAKTNGLDIVVAARSQIGVTVSYDPSYQKIDYPSGDIPRGRGVCSDVVIRALRDARGIDLQKLVHEDMRAHFVMYPSLTRWLMFKTDTNIDHRRVLNLERFFGRSGWSLEVTQDAAYYLPGDIVTCRLGGEVPHIMIVSDRKSPRGIPLAIHNIGGGTREEDCLFEYKITGHYRLEPDGNAEN